MTFYFFLKRVCSEYDHERTPTKSWWQTQGWPLIFDTILLAQLGHDDLTLTQNGILMTRGTTVSLSPVNTIGSFKTRVMTWPLCVCNENWRPVSREVAGLPWTETVQALKIEQELLPQQPTQCRADFPRINNWVWGNWLSNYHRSF